MKFPPGDPRPPSVPFPGSSLQARGGRLSLHVSPEMSHHLKHTGTHAHTMSPPHTALRLPPCSWTLDNLVCISIGCRGGLARKEKRRVYVCVCNSGLYMDECSCLWKFCVRDEVCNVSAYCSSGTLLVRKPWGLPDTASGHREEGDYLIAASHPAQIKTKVTLAN